ncbi:hypothetical protein NVP1084O_101 [Vibrio phage 1.084.O._10N.261.49.F5]|nr:hypothetical protein NVP1084O_101 [Vibrio phage 1.084.O._10N.261.49.F5]
MPKKEKNRVTDRRYHYTYLIKDNLHNKYYYGVHSTDFDPEDIVQYHSSSKHLKLIIKNFGVENFTKHIRRYFTSRDKADLWEYKVLRRMKVRSRKDFYVESGVCTGKFRAPYGRLKLGQQPCRCGDPKGFSKELYLHHVKELCKRESLTFLGLNGKWRGKKESKFIWVCRKGNTHYNTRVGFFLEKGSRCRCCISENSKSPPEKIDVNKELKNRYLMEISNEATN